MSSSEGAVASKVASKLAVLKNKDRRVDDQNTTTTTGKKSLASLTRTATEELEVIRSSADTSSSSSFRSAASKKTNGAHRERRSRGRPVGAVAESGGGAGEHSSRMFPPGCAELLYSLPGNEHCVDCDAPNPPWASVSYGVLLCLQCGGRHRSLGVQTSFVRSVYMDSWSHAQILTMLEGGNEQLSAFFRRHSLSPENGTDAGSIVERRYRTKAAKFYREQLALHVDKVASQGRYQGRDATRGRRKTRTERSSKRRAKSEHHKSNRERTSSSRRSSSTGPSRRRGAAAATNTVASPPKSSPLPRSLSGKEVKFAADL